MEDFSLSMSLGEVVCLLGCNGAGKSTIISMLVGLIKPDQGDADIFGVKLSENVEHVRELTSVCYQENFLFEELTIREHLQLVCNLRFP